MIRNIEDARALKAAGAKLDRAGLAEYVLAAARRCDGSYKGAMRLAGELKAVAIAAKFDDYWSEKVLDGYYSALGKLKQAATAKKED